MHSNIQNSIFCSFVFLTLHVNTSCFYILFIPIYTRHPCMFVSQFSLLLCTYSFHYCKRLLAYIQHLSIFIFTIFAYTVHTSIQTPSQHISYIILRVQSMHLTIHVSTHTHAASQHLCYIISRVHSLCFFTHLSKHAYTKRQTNQRTENYKITVNISREVKEERSKGGVKKQLKAF